jgi:phosphatidylserine/phosphatidylglycerophosphate/cardiolipin synthase-like enzyme
MGWADDVFGIVARPTECKVYARGGHTWAMKLGQLAKQKGVVRITTYSLPDTEYYFSNIFSKRPYDIYVICHAKFVAKACRLQALFPAIEFRVRDDIHGKMLLIEPKTVYIGSSNFGRSQWVEFEVGIRDKTIHDWCKRSFEELWQKSTPIYDGPDA